MNNVKSLAQKRSQFAYKKVEDAIKKYPNVKDEKTQKSVPSKQQKEYKAYVKKIPMMILTNGLGATFAFVYSKKDKDAYGLIYKQIDEWLQKNYRTGQCDKNTECYKDEKESQCSKIDLVKWIICLNSPEYRAVTNELLALFNWLKRFADGMIEGDGDGL